MDDEDEDHRDEDNRLDWDRTEGCDSEDDDYIMVFGFVHFHSF